MIIPDSGRKKALVIIDVQPAFTQDKRAIPNIQKLIQDVPYDLYVESIFWCDKTTMWAKQTNEDMVSRGEETLSEIKELLQMKPLIHVEKWTKSVFEGNIDLHKELQSHGIQEIHFVGYDTDDCVLTSAEDAFDRGYLTYVIEECVFSSSGIALHEYALAILRNVSLTNNSCVENIKKLNVAH